MTTRPVCSMLFALALCLYSGQAMAFPAFIVGAMGQNGALGIGNTNTVDTTGASLIICSQVVYAADGVTAPNDNKGNTFTLIASIDATPNNASVREEMYYVSGGTVGTGHIFSNNSNRFGTLSCAAYSGVTTLDTSGTIGTASDVTTLQYGSSITPAQSNSLVVAAVGTNADSSIGYSGYAINGGFTVRASTTGAPASGFWSGGTIADLVQTTPAAVQPTWSGWSTAVRSVAIIAVFNAGGGGAPLPGPPPGSLGLMGVGR